MRQCLSCSIKTSVSPTNTSASTQSLVHNQWGGRLIELSVVAEVDDDDYTQSLVHNQWNGGLNEHQSGSLPKKTLQTNGRTNMNIKIQKTVNKWGS